MFYSYAGITQPVDQKLNATGNDDSVVVALIVDGKKLKIDNSFSFTLVHNKDTIKIGVIDHRLIPPSELPDSIDYSVIFKYKKYSLFFNRISRKMLFPGQNYLFEFGIDNRPFDESLDLLKIEQYENDKTIRQLQYLRLAPLDFGDGLRYINKIMYKKK